MAIVIWRKKANHSRMNVLLYGRKEFGLHVANKMNRRIEHCAALLADHPRLGKIEPLLVGRRFDTRREPQRLTEEV